MIALSALLRFIYQTTNELFSNRQCIYDTSRVPTTSNPIILPVYPSFKLRKLHYVTIVPLTASPDLSPPSIKRSVTSVYFGTFLWVFTAKISGYGRAAKDILPPFLVFSNIISPASLPFEHLPHFYPHLNIFFLTATLLDHSPFHFSQFCRQHHSFYTHPFLQFNTFFNHPESHPI